MRNATGSIGFSQAVMMIMLSVGITTHATIIPLLLSKAARDAWISFVPCIPQADRAEVKTARPDVAGQAVGLHVSWF
ncbi:hypothetical protein [Brevibacillus borstelensis]|uniref:hypothetical protein n=1 Tax=Brevibacillus borstelensis TaxID=45462 RepID=UPI0030BAA129